MAKFELNIYGDNDEVLKKYATDHLRYGVLMQALELQEGMNGLTMGEQLEAANALVKKVFTGLTDEELACADAGDVLATFAQVTKHAEKIGKTPSGKKLNEGAEGDLGSHSYYFYLYECTVTLADRFRMTPFELFQQDCDEVISLLNYFLEKDAGEEKKEEKKQNDGFWDF